MSVQEIETVISQLPPADLAELAQWFEQFQENAWDRQIAQDVEAGRFDALRERVRQQRLRGAIHRSAVDADLSHGRVAQALPLCRWPLP